MSAPRHLPVLLEEVLDLLAPSGAGGLWLDATVGLGGHAAALLERAGAGAELLGVDKDPEALELAGQALGRFGDRARLEQGSFARVLEGGAGAWLRERGVPARRGLDGILMDLGVSSLQLDEGRRGFSFMRPGPLDMRMDPSAPLDASGWLAAAGVEELARVLRDYGEERRARALARAVLEERDRGGLKGTEDLARVALRVLGRGGRDAAHPATRLFQALRIAVNAELDDLAAALPALAGLLAPGGRIAVISFHSLEDRMVKAFFRRESSECVCPPGLPECRCGHKATLRTLTPKPRVASAAELETNPRARSAKLRAAQRL